MSKAKKPRAKLKKYRIEVDDFTEENNSRVIAEHFGKGKTQDWLHTLKHHCSDKQKHELLLAFYDKRINDHEWQSGILDFLINSAIDTRFDKVIGKPFRVGAEIYTISVETE